jgi:hypothetical protein
MCGIAGIVSLDGFDPEVLVNLTHLARHRGPDGFGFAYGPRDPENDLEIIHNQDRRPKLTSPIIGLGNRRLAILDLSELGNMPMQTEDGAVCVTYNGEIYNYREVRSELEAAGHRFRTGTDTEVLLKAYQEWGEDCLSHFNGMWSFGLWDRRNSTIGAVAGSFTSAPKSSNSCTARGSRESPTPKSFINFWSSTCSTIRGRLFSKTFTSFPRGTRLRCMPGIPSSAAFGSTGTSPSVKRKQMLAPTRTFATNSALVGKTPYASGCGATYRWALL